MKFPITRSVSAFTSRYFHGTKCLLEFFEKDSKGSYPIKYDKPPTIEKNFFKRSKVSLKLLQEQFKMFAKELKGKFYMAPILMYRKGEVDVQYRFNGDPKCLENWVVTSDSDNGEGYSSASLELSVLGTGVFSGILDTRIPKDGCVSRSGYCNIRTVPLYKPFFREVSHDWTNYTHLIMHIRGDGRTYFINLSMNCEFDVGWYDMYNYLLYTRGGPYWQYVRIPFSKFFFTYKGHIQNKQSSIEKDSIKHIGITIADKITGPFKLEIDYIGVECDLSYTEQFAYEQYKFARPLP